MGPSPVFIKSPDKRIEAGTITIFANDIIYDIICHPQGRCRILICNGLAF